MVCSLSPTFQSQFTSLWLPSFWPAEGFSPRALFCRQRWPETACISALTLQWRVLRNWHAVMQNWKKCVCIMRDTLSKNNLNFLSYVYWTMQHLDSWIKRDQLDVTCFIISLFNAQHVSDINTSILRSLRLICWVISWVVLLWFDVCWCYIVVWLGWCGIRMQAEALVPYGYHTTPAKSQCNTNTHRTRAIQPMK